MIRFTMKDFKEADAKTDKLYRELLAARKHCEKIESEIEIAEEERNFIGGWLERNGVSKEDFEVIEDKVKPYF